MKKKLHLIPVHMLLLAGLLPIAPAALAAEDDVTEKTQAQLAPGKPGLREVTFLGVETVETDNATRKRLNLADGTGLRVRGVGAGSPAAGKLQAGDVLVRFEDQILCNQEQLRALVQARKPDDTVALALYRDGEAMETRVELGLLRTQADAGRPAEKRSPDVRITLNGKEVSLHDMLRENMGGFRERFLRDDFISIDPDVLRDISTETRETLRQMQEDIKTRRERWEKRRQAWESNIAGGEDAPAGRAEENTVASPSSQVRIEIVEEGATGRADKASGAGSRAHAGTATSSSATSSVHDENGSATLTVQNGLSHVTIRDRAGKVIFEGAVDTEEQRAALPAEARQRLETLESLCAGCDPLHTLKDAPATD